jgi:hypothetical protein
MRYVKVLTTSDDIIELITIIDIKDDAVPRLSLVTAAVTTIVSEVVADESWEAWITTATVI